MSFLNIFFSNVAGIIRQMRNTFFGVPAVDAAIFPDPDERYRSTLCTVEGDPGISDSLYYGAKNASDGYDWRELLASTGNGLSGGEVAYYPTAGTATVNAARPLIWDNANETISIGRLQSAPKIIGVNTQLELVNTGGTFHTMKMIIVNEGGANGVIMEQDSDNGASGVVDFMMRPSGSGGGTGNIRLEDRGGGQYTSSSGKEWQFGSPGDPNLVSSDNALLYRKGSYAYVGSTIAAAGIVPAQRFVINTSDVTLSAASGVQSPFASANDTLTVAASTTYFFEAWYYLTTGTTTHTTATAFGGTATFTSIAYWAELWSGTATTISTTAPSVLEVLSASSTVLNATSTAAKTVIRLRGVMRINGAGTIIPQINFSANPTGTNLGKTNSFFRCWPVGSNTVASQGSWA